ncbi:hypothetical protein C8R47DRAFT_1075823 [Mycena vitilis]|nr:hypothetical protein C8R47DRAFT_1075823 [Mycena vitilis]
MSTQAHGPTFAFSLSLSRNDQASSFALFSNVQSALWPYPTTFHEASEGISRLRKLSQAQNTMYNDSGQYHAVQALCAQRTQVRISCGRRVVSAAHHGRVRKLPCTQCKKRGIECEYAPQEDYSPQYSTRSLGDTHEELDYGGWVPRPITAPSAAMSTYLNASPPSSRTSSPASHDDGAPECMLMASTSSRPTIWERSDTHPNSFAYSTPRQASTSSRSIVERPPFRADTDPRSFAYSAPTQASNLSQPTERPLFRADIDPHSFAYSAPTQASTPSQPMELPPFRPSADGHPESFAYSAPTQYQLPSPTLGVLPYYSTTVSPPFAPDPVNFGPLYGEYGRDYAHEVQRRASYPSTWPQPMPESSLSLMSSEAQRRASYPSTWPHSMSAPFLSFVSASDAIFSYSMYDAPYHDPNRSAQ